ncbi:unnamed protein product [Alopecurus aequalis]
MHYDEHYTPYIRRTGLLPFINMVKDGVPKMNACLVTALVDRWRPETHTFHLQCGEMTVTLQDVSMITSLPIRGHPICRNTDSSQWREQMSSYLGMEPGIKGRAAGATYGWIAKNFGKCPTGCPVSIVERHARAYLWVALCRTVFGNSGGSNVPFFWLELLADWDYRWSWGTAALAWLYRQLDDVCRKIDDKKQSNIGSCMVLLSVWSWEHFAIGRPVPDTNTLWEEEGDPDRLPTWILRWYKVNREWGPAPSLYLDYTNQFDMLHHSMEEPHNTAAYDAYLTWLGDMTRLKLLSPAFNPEEVYAMADADDIDLDEMKYFKGLRENFQGQELAPVANWVNQAMSTHYDEATKALECPPGHPESESILQKFVERTRKLAKGFTAALGCHKVDDVSPMRSGSSSHHSSRGRGRHGEGSGVHMETSSRAQEEEQNDDGKEEEDDEGHEQDPQDEINISQMSRPTIQTQFEWSPFELRERGRPRREKKYTPDALRKGKDPSTST